MSEGFVAIGRSFFKNFLWTEEREFSRAEAWLDLVSSCAYQPQKKIVAGELVEVPRGGIVASERFLSDRWKWSRTKVRAFLALLVSEEMIRPEKNHRNTVFFLCNFEKYNPQKNHPPDQGKDRRGTSEEPQGNQVQQREQREHTNGVCHAGEPARPPRPAKSLLPDEEFFAALRSKYTWANIDAERARAEAWLMTPKGRGRSFTRQFFVNWLNKLDVPMPKAKRTPTAAPAEEPLADPAWWPEFLTIHPEHDGQHFAQLSAAEREHAKDWAHREAGKTLAQLKSTLKSTP